MIICVEYIVHKIVQNKEMKIKVMDTRSFADNNYPRVLGFVLREYYERGIDVQNIRQIDAVHKDLANEV